MTRALSAMRYAHTNVPALGPAREGRGTRVGFSLSSEAAPATILTQQVAQKSSSGAMGVGAAGEGNVRTRAPPRSEVKITPRQEHHKDRSPVKTRSAGPVMNTLLSDSRHSMKSGPPGRSTRHMRSTLPSSTPAATPTHRCRRPTLHHCSSTAQHLHRKLHLEAGSLLDTRVGARSPAHSPATTVAQAPVPHASVGPAPRSHTTMRTCWRLYTSTNSVLVRAGKTAWRSHLGPRPCRSSSSICAQHSLLANLSVPFLRWRCV